MKNKLTILISVLLVIVSIFLVITLFFSPDVMTDKNKTIVYVFSAGGCPFCEQEIDYLKGLDSYNQKFIIKEKEMYVDHISWEPGKDYKLGLKVEKLFKEKFGEEATISGTPYIVIGNIYAKAGLNKNLERYIVEDYNSDYLVDVVGCVAENGENCLENKERKINGLGYLPVRIIEIVVMITGLILCGLFIKLLRTK